METTEDQVEPDPLQRFELWRREALEAEELRPDAMALATAGKDGRPSVRFVILRSVDERGFVFYTNYDSRKGRDLVENPWGSVVFYWAKSGRQISVEGPVERVEEGGSDAYYRTRPGETRLEAWASPQSQVIADRGWLERRWSEREARPKALEKRPEWWGGYRLRPQVMEFWEQRARRMHDRLRYSQREDGTWAQQRLAP